MFTKFHRIKLYNRHFNINFQSLTEGLNLGTLTGDLKSKTDDLLNASLTATLDNALKMLTIVENKIKSEKLNNIDINVSLMLGPVNISISKKILISDNIE